MAVPDLVEKQTEPVRLKMSYEEFLRWSDEDTHAEWVDGEVIVFIPPKPVHQITLNFLNRLLSLFVELFDLGQQYRKMTSDGRPMTGVKHPFLQQLVAKGGFLNYGDSDFLRLGYSGE